MRALVRRLFPSRTTPSAPQRSAIISSPQDVARQQILGGKSITAFANAHKVRAPIPVPRFGAAVVIAFILSGFLPILLLGVGSTLNYTRFETVFGYLGSLPTWQVALGVGWTVVVFGAVLLGTLLGRGDEPYEPDTELKPPRVALEIDEEDARLLRCVLESGAELCRVRLDGDIYQAVEQATLYKVVVDEINDEILVQFGVVISAEEYASELASQEKLEARTDKNILEKAIS